MAETLNPVNIGFIALGILFLLAFSCLFAWFGAGFFRALRQQNHYAKRLLVYRRDRLWQAARMPERRAGLQLELQREFDKVVEEGFRARMAAEAEPPAEAGTKKKERVWLSHFTRNGRLSHWVLITHGHKYELRRTQPRTRRERGRAGGAVEADESRVEWLYVSGRAGSYECSPGIRHATIDEARRELAVRSQQGPAVEGLYYSVIGWTDKTKDEVDRACRDIMAEFGGYKLLFNNCQQFLRRFAGMIVTERSEDWQWFIAGTLSRYRYMPLVDPAALAILNRFWEEVFARLRDGPRTTAHQRRALGGLVSKAHRHNDYLRTQYSDTGVGIASCGPEP